MKSFGVGASGRGQGPTSTLRLPSGSDLPGPGSTGRRGTGRRNTEAGGRRRAGRDGTGSEAPEGAGGRIPAVAAPSGAQQDEH